MHARHVTSLMLDEIVGGFLALAIVSLQSVDESRCMWTRGTYLDMWLARLLVLKSRLIKGSR